MKRKKFCKSDLMIATIPLIGSQLLLLLSSTVVLAEAQKHLNHHHRHHNPHNYQQQQQQSNSLHISHKIIHHQQLPAANERSSESDAGSYAATLEQGDAPMAPPSVQQQPQQSQQAASMSSSIADEQESVDSSTSERGDFESEPQRDEPTAENSQEAPERNLFDHHNSRLQAMHELFERRQLNNQRQQHQMPSSQELNPISIGLDAVSGAGGPFGMPPFPVVPNHEAAKPPPLSSADQIDQGLGPPLPFGLNPLPHLLGFQNTPFDGPQRGDQSAHSNHHAAADQESGGAGGSGGAGSGATAGSQKVWPKIFRFTDGRINLSEFEKQKKIRLSSKNQHNTENHIESAPIIFDGRPLKRKSFLILHGGIFSK